MDVTESSVVARKLRNFYVNQHSKSAATARQPVWNADELELESPEEKTGILRQALMVSLMGIAVALTEVSLFLIKCVRKLEENA